MGVYRNYFLKKLSDFKSDLITNFPNSIETDKIIKMLEVMQIGQKDVSDENEHQLLKILQDAQIDTSDFVKDIL